MESGASAWLAVVYFPLSVVQGNRHTKWLTKIYQNGATRLCKCPALGKRACHLSLTQHNAPKDSSSICMNKYICTDTNVSLPSPLYYTTLYWYDRKTAKRYECVIIDLANRVISYYCECSRANHSFHRGFFSFCCLIVSSNGVLAGRSTQIVGLDKFFRLMGFLILVILYIWIWKCKGVSDQYKTSSRGGGREYLSNVQLPPPGST